MYNDYFYQAMERFAQEFNSKFPDGYYSFSEDKLRITLEIFKCIKFVKNKKTGKIQYFENGKRLNQLPSSSILNKQLFPEKRLLVRPEKGVSSHYHSRKMLIERFLEQVIMMHKLDLSCFTKCIIFNTKRQVSLESRAINTISHKYPKSDVQLDINYLSHENDKVKIINQNNHELISYVNTTIIESRLHGMLCIHLFKHQEKNLFKVFKEIRDLIDRLFDKEALCIASKVVGWNGFYFDSNNHPWKKHPSADLRFLINIQNNILKLKDLNRFHPKLLFFAVKLSSKKRYPLATISPKLCTYAQIREDLQLSHKEMKFIQSLPSSVIVEKITNYYRTDHDTKTALIKFLATYEHLITPQPAKKLLLMLRYVQPQRKK